MGTAKFEIKDVTSLGKQLSSEADIIYPRGTYDGVAKIGRTNSIKFDAKIGTFTVHKVTTHTPEEDEEFALPLMASRNHSNQQKKKIEQMKTKLTLGHGGPIVRQTFISGDYCEEVHTHRRTVVELRCCTGREINDWTQNRKN